MKSKSMRRDRRYEGVPQLNMVIQGSSGHERPLREIYRSRRELVSSESGGHMPWNYSAFRKVRRRQG